MENTLLPASNLLEEINETPLVPDYSEEERLYLIRLQKRLESAKLKRELPHSEFDDMTYTQYVQKNEELANTKIKPKVNKQDIQFQSGTLRTKLFAFLNSLTSLNLGAHISVFDENEIVISRLGDAFEDIIDKTNELDEDEEKKMMRQYELLKQGHVFVEEMWDDGWIVEKDQVDNYNGKFRGVKIKTRKAKKLARPKRTIISGLSVYLGDLTKYLISDQPYVFTARTMGYDEARKIYDGFEMWKYVSRKLRPWSGDSDKAMSENAWRLFDGTEEMVEIMKYQDKPNHEYQIIINGVPMLPIGFPFPWGYDEYSITQQNGKPIRHDFAYGKSFISENKNIIQLLDEMMRLALLKTEKSLLPPYLNISGRVISSNVLMPGRISMGIQPGTLVPVSDKEIQGVTNAEYLMIQELVKNIDQQTTSQTFTGSSEKGQVTATQIIELQRQARLMLGTVILTASLLEKKLVTLRLMNLIKKWFEPLNQSVDEFRQVLKNKYRTVSRPFNVEGEGAGTRMVIPTEENVTPERIRQTEEYIKKETGMPTRLIFLNPQELEKTKLLLVVNINPREKRSSELGKLMFKGMITDAMELGLTVSPTYIEERFAQVWEEDPSKMFDKSQVVPPNQAPEATQGANQRALAEVGVNQGSQRRTTPIVQRPQLKVNQGRPLL